MPVLFMMVQPLELTCNNNNNNNNNIVTVWIRCPLVAPHGMDNCYMWTSFSPFAGLYLINTKVGHACYFDFDTPIELEVFLKMLDAAKI